MEIVRETEALLFMHLNRVGEAGFLMVLSNTGDTKKEEGIAEALIARYNQESAHPNKEQPPFLANIFADICYY